MGKAVAFAGLTVMLVGLLLVMFGTQQISVSQLVPIANLGGANSWVTTPSGQGIIYYAVEQITTQPSYAINFIGMFVAVLGAFTFSISYPIKRLGSLPANAIPLSF